MLNEVLTSRVISETNLVTLMKKWNIKSSEVLQVHAKGGGWFLMVPEWWGDESERSSKFATGHRFQDSKIQYISKKENWVGHENEHCQLQEVWIIVGFWRERD